MKIFKWFLALNKRLYKKATFVIFMALVPLAVLLLSLAARGESGFLSVVIAAEDENDPIACAMIEDFMSEESIVLFRPVDDPDKAFDAVKTGQADSAWVFSEDIEEKLERFSVGKSLDEPIVTVYEREQNVLTRLLREKLSAAVFEHCARAKYISFSQANVPGLDLVDGETLGGYFDGIFLERELFVFESGADSDVSVGSTNYVTAPLRGLLSVIVLLSGLSATLLYMKDEKKGVFSLVKETRRPLVSFACVFIAVLNMVLAVLIALFASGMAGGIVRELLGALMYSVCTALFCLVLGNLLVSTRVISVAIPLLALATCAICPVFFDFGQLKSAAHLFPPTYFIKLLYNNEYFAYMGLYALALAVLLALIYICKGKIRMCFGGKRR